MRAHAREIAAQAPPLSPDQISKIRKIFGFDATPVSYTVPAIALESSVAGVPAPAAANNHLSTDPHEVLHEPTACDPADAA